MVPETNHSRTAIISRPTAAIATAHRFSVSHPAVFDEKRRALASYKSSPSERTLQMLRATRSKVQQISRRCANYFWLQLCNHLQVCADTGNLNGMYDGIKQAIEPMQSRIVPLKSATGDAIKDKYKQMER